jgi:hypothetical protein
MTEALQGMSDEERDDPAKRGAKLQAAAAEVFKTNQMDDPNGKKAKEAAFAGFDALSQRVKNDKKLSQFGNVSGLFDMNDAEILKRGKGTIGKAESDAKQANAVVGEGQQDMVTKFSDLIQNLHKGKITAAKFSEEAAKLSGGVPVGKPGDPGNPGAGKDDKDRKGKPEEIVIRGNLEVKDGSIIEIHGKGDKNPGAVPGN